MAASPFSLSPCFVFEALVVFDVTPFTAVVDYTCCLPVSHRVMCFLVPFSQ